MTRYIHALALFAKAARRFMRAEITEQEMACQITDAKVLIGRVPVIPGVMNDR